MKPASRIAALALVCAALSTTSASAQTFPTDDSVIKAIWSEGMEEGSRIEELAQALLDSIGPRLTGTPGFEEAAEWLLARYAEWGIDAEKQVYGTWTGWERGFTHIDLVEPRQRTLEGTMLAWSPGTAGPVEGEVVAMPLFSSPEEYRAWVPSAAGKFVAFSFPEPTCREDRSWEDWARPATVERMKADRNRDR
ncbi:MAG: peptidase M28, partial [Gemmatimonadota bacterium]|nr:peptidase M28 [Gemmatimonadota bacterium]